MVKVKVFLKSLRPSQSFTWIPPCFQPEAGPPWAEIFFASSSTFLGNSESKPFSMAMACISVSLSPGFPKILTTFPIGALLASFQETISAKTFWLARAEFKASFGMRMSVYIFVSSGFTKNMLFLAPSLAGSDSNIPAKPTFALVTIFNTSALWRPDPFGCKIISTKSPCSAVFRCLKSISGSCWSPSVATYPVPLEEIEIMP